jgi:hypothetical protein
MQLGVHLRELWELKRGIAISLLLASFAALSSIYKIGLIPPRLESRGLELGVASTQLLVDTPRSKVVNIDSGASEFASLTTQAGLLGNVMASPPVRAYIAREIGADPTRILATAPITANFPRALAEPGSGQSASDILASPDHYRLQIQADPSVPVLRIYAQAPSAEKAVRLADASVQGLRKYLADIAARQRIPPAEQVRVEQFGQARGGIINQGIALQIAVLAFGVIFGIACCAVLFLARVRRGWVAAALQARTQARTQT